MIVILPILTCLLLIILGILAIVPGYWAKYFGNKYYCQRCRDQITQEEAERYGHYTESRP